MAQPDAAVVIAGGGPVGLALAITLAQRGVRSVVVERHASPQPIPRGQNLTQRTMEHFHFWGIERELRAARTVPPEYGIGGMTSYGTLLGQHHYDWLNRSIVKPYYYADNERLPQYATETVLRRRAAEFEAIDIRYGWSVENVEQDEAGVRVHASKRDGSDSVTLRAGYAVGCDGSRSVVRQAAGIDQDRSDHDRLMVLLVFRSKELSKLLERFPGKSFYNVLHPRLEGYWQFFGRVDLDGTFFFHAPVPAGTTAQNGDFTSLLHAAVGAEFAFELMHVGFWDLRFAIATQYRNGRIFIAGDAAHSHPPYGGYGINSGFEDAVNLGWKIAAAEAGWGGNALLDSYDAERRPVFESTARDFIAKSIRQDRAFLAAFDPDRDLAAFETEWTRRRDDAAAEVDAFEPNYEGSRIVTGVSPRQPSAVGSHKRTAIAGHHLFPGHLADGRNVYEALGSGFTLLVRDRERDAAHAFERAAARLKLPITIIEAAEDVWEAPLVLVRPDQFIAWCGHEVADTDRILARAIGRDEDVVADSRADGNVAQR